MSVFGKKLFGRIMISIRESDVVESRKEVRLLKEEIKAMQRKLEIKVKFTDHLASELENLKKEYDEQLKTSSTKEPEDVNH